MNKYDKYIIKNLLIKFGGRNSNSADYDILEKSNNSELSIMNKKLSQSIKLIEIDDEKKNNIKCCIESIGKGTFGTVYRGLDENTGNMVIIKKINITNKKGGDKMKSKIESEIEIMKMLDDKHFIKLLGNNSSIEYDSEEEHEIKKEIIEIHMEDVCGKSLKNISKSLGGLNLNLVKKYGYEIAKGLEYLHNNNIIHMDIKADNILLSNKGEIKIIDFGESIIPSFISLMKKTFNIPFAGTESHMSPEIFIQMNPYIENINKEINKKNIGKSDIWSFGIVLVEIFVGEINELEHKNNNSNISIVRQMMSTNNLEYTCDKILFICLNSILQKINIESTSKDVANIITDIITDDTINDDILYYIDFICCCLEKNIDRRLSAKQLLEHYFIDSTKIKKFMSNNFISLGISL